MSTASSSLSRFIPVGQQPPNYFGNVGSNQNLANMVSGNSQFSVNPTGNVGLNPPTGPGLTAAQLLAPAPAPTPVAAPVQPAPVAQPTPVQPAPTPVAAPVAPRATSVPAIPKTAPTVPSLPAPKPPPAVPSPVSKAPGSAADILHFGLAPAGSTTTKQTVPAANLPPAQAVLQAATTAVKDVQAQTGAAQTVHTGPLGVDPTTGQAAPVGAAAKAAAARTAATPGAGNPISTGGLDDEDTQNPLRFGAGTRLMFAR